ncbi:MAG: hypothetical protein J5I93_17960 [Pirellulaceae bacterium]|nr:hypothetical protein [Pirellulaceae bacterium]
MSESIGSADVRPAPAFWLLPGAVALLRAIPFLWTRLAPSGPDQAMLPVGYMPPDLMSYVAFIRQAAERGSVLLQDPYSTAEQSGRFILLLHWLLGQVCRVTGWAPELVLELSRFPLTFAFFAVLWRFLGKLLDNRPDRYCACLLVAFSGGIEGFVKPLEGWMSPLVREQLHAGVWHLYGWNTFAALYNPLWIAGLTLMLVCLGLVLNPRGPATIGQGVRLGGTFCLLFFVHPYSALATLAVAVAAPLCQSIFQRQIDRTRLIRLAAALGPACLLVGLVGRWQVQDPLYRQVSANVLGTLHVPVFWYPLTLGAVGLLAAWGAQRWARQAHPYRYGLLGWIAAVVWLHTSPVLNGYHFICYLHLPLCVLAAGELRRLVERFRAGELAPRWVPAGGLVLVFGSSVFLTFEALGDLSWHNRVPRDYLRVADWLSRQPRQPDDHVLAPPELGNLLPAYTGQHVWVGHWFLTPEYHPRVARWRRWIADAENDLPDGSEVGEELRALIAEERIRYLILPRAVSGRLAGDLPSRIERRVTLGELDVLVLEAQGTG